MFCARFKKEVITNDCEDCLTQRISDPICFKRGFVWGVSSNEPMWKFTYEVAKDLDIDVSYYYDPKWEGNTHLIQRNNITYKKKIIPPDIRWAVLERDNFTCQYCGSRKYLAIDHIYPESMGGTIELSNLQTLCKHCNSKKSNKIEFVVNINE